MKKNRPAFAILALLVGVVILFLLYYVSISSLGGPRARTAPEKAEDQPWYNESKIREDQNVTNRWKQENAMARSAIKITSFTTIQGPVKSDKSDRGTIILRFDPNGFMFGSWTAKYSYTHAAYVIKAEFSGNADPGILMTGSDGNPDQDLLGFSARGTYTQTATNLDSGQKTINKGILYVNGTLDENMHAQGKISLTNDKNWHIDYPFEAQ